MHKTNTQIYLIWTNRKINKQDDSLMIVNWKALSRCMLSQRPVWMIYDKAAAPLHLSSVRQILLKSGFHPTWQLCQYLTLKTRDAPVDRPKIGTGRFLLIMRDRQPAGFCLFFGRFFRKCEHVICVEDIRQEHNKHRKTDTMKRTAVGVTLLAHK